MLAYLSRGRCGQVIPDKTHLDFIGAFYSAGVSPTLRFCSELGSWPVSPCSSSPYCSGVSRVQRETCQVWSALCRDQQLGNIQCLGSQGRSGNTLDSVNPCSLTVFDNTTDEKHGWKKDSQITIYTYQ